jgi:drug/metabolite transporter (DMT)-like permease
MVYVLGLLAALSYALGNVLQQRGTLNTKAAEGDPRFLAEILRKPVWLLGVFMSLLGWVFQAIALHDGSLAVVQSLCALSLVFALPLGARLTNQVIGRRSIVGALITLAGIVLFIVVGQPQGGISEPSATTWWTAGIVVAILMAPLVIMASRRRGPAAAALFAVAAGLCLAFQAAVTKVFTAEVGQGFVALVSAWSTWLVILTGVIGFGLQQASLKTGYLAPSMAGVNSSDLVASVLLAVFIYQETLNPGGGRLLPALIGMALAVVGVMILADPEKGQAKPVTETASAGPPAEPAGD